MTTTPADIIENARKAKTFIACAGEGPIPDQLLLRAAVAYNMMVQQGWIVPPKDDLDLPHAIAQIAANFSDDPLNTIHRRKLFATPLDDAAVAEPEASVDPRQMSLLADPVAQRVASIVAHHHAEAKRFDRAADDFDKLDNADAADRCRTKAGHTRSLAAQIERGDDLLEGRTFKAGPAGTITHPEVTGRTWQRGDLVLVDGDKEGCVTSVNGNVAQVALWDRAPAVVNVSRLSPLEPAKQYVSASEDGTGFYRAPENDHNAGLTKGRMTGVDIDLSAFKQVVKAIAPLFEDDAEDGSL